MCAVTIPDQHTLAELLVRFLWPHSINLSFDCRNVQYEERKRKLMPLTRRDFLISSSLSLAAGALLPVLLQVENEKPSTTTDFGYWESVRKEFELSSDYINIALFHLASHHRPV